MKLVEGLSFLKNKIKSLSLREAKGHMDHPEDLVFLQGSFGAQRAVQAIIDTVKDPKAITIKWDGYPALIFGYGEDGKFSIMDKHMFNKGTNSPARYIHSPKEFVDYDRNRGVTRSELDSAIAQLWPELQKVTPKQKGYYWGDLLFASPLLKQKDGLYHFRANPNGISYTVDPNSEVGKLLTGKNAAIVVHQKLPSNAETTDDNAESLGGTTGGLVSTNSVAVLPAQMPITPNLKIDNGLVNKANQSIQKYGDELDNFFANPPQAVDAFTNLFTSYINKRIREKNLQKLTDGFFQYVASRPMTDSMRNKLLGYTDPATKKHVPGYLDSNRKTIEHIFEIWIDVYNLKMNLVPQLDKAAETSPVQGYLETGEKSQEGFVSQGLKLINRMGFSAQNLAAR